MLRAMKVRAKAEYMRHLRLTPTLKRASARTVKVIRKFAMGFLPFDEFAPQRPSRNMRNALSFR